MIERRRIVELWQERPVSALATLVRVEGSSYRAEGARMLIAADGSYAGSISGGCLEAEIVRKAQWMVRSGPVLQRYSTLFDDTAEIPYGLGCGGTVEVLLEPAGTPAFDSLLRAMEESLGGASLHVKTVFDPVRKVLQRSVGIGSASLLAGAAIEVDEVLEPPLRLILFGAGEDARPVVQMAALLGWNTAVMDSRSQWARRERFPLAQRVEAADEISGLEISERDAVVLMTHSYEQDRRWLEQVLPCRPRYLGMLGSRHRSALLVAEAAESLGWTLDDACRGVFSPVGLDLGGDGAEAVALSIAAEIQASVQGKLGASRRVTPEMVRKQIEQGGASRYLQAQCAL